VTWPAYRRASRRRRSSRGPGRPRRLRLSLLDWKDDVVAILVDSLDGATFDALTAEADGILASVAFDKD
jgi:hypothetical protein